MTASSPHHRQDPAPEIPDALFADDAVENRWRGRFTAARVSVPDWARDAPDHSVYSSNATGTWEIYAWDRSADTHRRVTDRPNGTRGGAASTDGTAIWWFDDTDGDEFGVWVREPFDGGVGGAGRLRRRARLSGGAGAGPAHGGRRLVDRRRVDARGQRGAGRRVRRGPGRSTRTPRTPGSARCRATRRCWRSRTPSTATRATRRCGCSRVADGAAVGERHDGEGKGLDPIEFAPVEGDQRLLVGHERRGRDELLIWDLATDTETELDIDLPGDLSAGFYPDASALLVAHTRAGRTTLHRYDLATGALSDLPTAAGSVGGADVRPDGTVEYGWSSAAYPSSVRALRPDGTDTELLAPPGERPEPSVALRGRVGRRGRRSGPRAVDPAGGHDRPRPDRVHDPRRPAGGRRGPLVARSARCGSTRASPSST